MSEHVTRLAPSPTGALHLGNARTFLVNWLLARRQGWRVLMRVEDLDGPRVKAGSDRQLLEELAWLGLTWDGPAVYQSARAPAYREVLERLVELGQAYPCVCSRKDAEQAASAPHAGEGPPAYPGTCRGRFASYEEAVATGKPVAWRVMVPAEPVVVEDRFAGRHEFDLRAAGGDFVIVKAENVRSMGVSPMSITAVPAVDHATTNSHGQDAHATHGQDARATSGLAAYQLAVVVDDAAAGVDAIVRGDDLLESAARQIHLRRLLGLRPEPAYWHLPLVVGTDGRRLAKRHGDTRLSHYRAAGTTPERLLGLLGHWSGLLPERRPATLAELLERFDIDLVPRTRIVFNSEDDRFLTE